MTKYFNPKKEILSACDPSMKKFINATVADIAHLAMYCPEGCCVAFSHREQPMNGQWWWPPRRRRSESERGFRSRVYAWAWRFFDEFIVNRINDEDMDICGFITPADNPEYKLFLFNPDD